MKWYASYRVAVGCDRAVGRCITRPQSKRVVRPRDGAGVIRSGPLTLLYPEWIPGEHGPVGPIANLAGVKINAAGTAIPWTREPHNEFAFDFVVPKGVSQIDVDFTYLGATFGSYSSNRLASANMAALVWNQVALYPSTGTGL